jgi:hypothetical protein
VASDKPKYLLKETLEYKPENHIDLAGLIEHHFLRYGCCPDSLPETVFDKLPTFVVIDMHHSEKKPISKDKSRGTKIEQEDITGEGPIAEGTKKEKMQAKIKVISPKAIADILDIATTAEACRAKA